MLSLLKINNINPDDYRDNLNPDDIYLCRKLDNVFTSTVRPYKSYGYYVDDVKGKQIYMINELDELYLIKFGESNEIHT